jgi:ketosteroid isomerase-like protein
MIRQGFGRGTPPFGGTYENEYVHMLHISPGTDGVSRITEIKEFMDSVAINALMERMQRARSSKDMAKSPPGYV